MPQLSYDEIERLAPCNDGSETLIEGMEAYAKRFQQTFPNFPSNVITQWFYEHRDAIHQNSWLPFDRLTFSLVEFTASDVFDLCFADNPFVDQYRTHFEEENTSQRMSRISEYIIENFTWPVPPIVMANPKANIESPWGMKCDSPFHLLEGHHRFAVLHAYKAKLKLKSIHKIWVAKVKEEQAFDASIKE